MLYLYCFVLPNKEKSGSIVNCIIISSLDVYLNIVNFVYFVTIISLKKSHGQVYIFTSNLLTCLKFCGLNFIPSQLIILLYKQRCCLHTICHYAYHNCDHIWPTRWEMPENEIIISSNKGKNRV